MEKKYKATIVLGISALGYGLTAPLAASGFWGGCLHNACLAATIGGLADWFAVTALFRKPLGISYRTEILVRNRQRILGALAEYASHDLLSEKNIMAVFAKQDLAGMLVDYLVNRAGRQKLTDAAEKAVCHLAAGLDAKVLAAELVNFIPLNSAGTVCASLGQNVISSLQQEEIKERALTIIAGICREFLQSEGMQNFLLQEIGVIRKRYEENSAGRAAVMQMLAIDDQKLLTILNAKTETWLTEMQKNEQGEKLLHYLAEAVRDNIAPQQFMQQAVEGVLREVQSNEVLLREQCVSFIAEQIDNLVQHPVRQAKLDKWIKTILFQVISKYHHIIPETIQARLDEFSDEELVEFVEGHIADDIQMIRINGAMVGSLVGMGLYALIYVAERMWQ